jgi:hypothetical protein
MLTLTLADRSFQFCVGPQSPTTPTDQQHHDCNEVTLVFTDVASLLHFVQDQGESWFESGSCGLAFNPEGQDNPADC